MTVSTTIAEEVFPCNGVQTVFSVAFSVVEDEEIVVLKRDGATDTTQVLNVDYTLSGVGGTNGFTITMAVAPANGLELIVYRVSDKTQDILLTETGGFNLSGIMSALDRQARLTQEVLAIVARSVRVRVGETPIGEVTGGELLDRADRALVFSNDGVKLTIGPTAAEIAGAQAEALAAAQSALDAAAEANDAAQQVILAAAQVAAAQAIADDLALEFAKYPNLTGNALSYLRVKADELAYEFRTAAQTLIDIGLYTAATGSAKIPVGTTAERDEIPAVGMIRYNLTLGRYEGYAADATWKPIGGGGLFKGEGGTIGTSAGDIFRINEKELNTNVTIDATENASAAGPLTIASGVTITVASGGTLVIV